MFLVGRVEGDARAVSVDDVGQFPIEEKVHSGVIERQNVNSHHEKEATLDEGHDLLCSFSWVSERHDDDGVCSELV